MLPAHHTVQLLIGGRSSATVIGAAITLFLLPAPAFAAATGLPWETALETVVNSLQGPIVTLGAAAAVTVAGLTYAFGEAGSMMRRSVGIVGGLAIAIGATAVVTQLFGPATGMAY